jgi:TPP-dependent pyruvate/acetoin dehydrogenase alpha subunit
LQISDETLVDWYKQLVTIKQLDNILYEAQRQVPAGFFLSLLLLFFSCPS